MALFKVSRGSSENLPNSKTDGYCYVTLDEQKFYFDFKNKNDVIQRGILNANNADTVNNHTVLSDVPQDAVFTDTIFIHPNDSNWEKGLGLYKISIDSNGHVTSAEQVVKGDIINLGIASSEHTHNQSDILQAADDVLILDCGTSLINV